VIAEALRFAAAGAGPQALALGELGAFPSRSRPRILWVGVQAPPSLELLQDRIERGSEAIGFAPEGTPFKPHVTLAYCHGTSDRDAADFLHFAGDFRTDPFWATHFVMYSSRATRSGSQYVEEAVYPLVGTSNA